MLTPFDKYDKLNETFFYDREEVNRYLRSNQREKKTPIEIGDIVYHIDHDLKIYNSTDHSTYTSELIRNIDKFKNIPLKVVSKYKGDFGDTFPWWSEIVIVGKELQHTYWFIDAALSKEKPSPSYKPKGKIERTFESNNRINENYFNNDNELNNFINRYNISKPNIKVGDVVTIKDNYKEIIELTEKKYDMTSTFHDIDKIGNELIGKKLVVDRKFKYNETDRYPWWSSILPKDKSSNKEMWVFDSILDIKPSEPTYKPKGKVERTFENIILEKDNTIDTAKEICVICVDSFESNFLINLALSYGYTTSRTDFYSDFPIYLYFHLLDKKITYMTGYDMRTNYNGDISEYTMFNGVWEHNFYMKDIKIVEQILKSGVIISPAPSYKPKGKVERTLESTEWYPYRFKTGKEFIEEFGTNWRRRVRQVWANDMDYLLGTPYPFEEKDIHGGSLHNYDNWFISWDMITPNEKIVPTYKPKGKVERTLESKTDYPYRFKTEKEFIEEFGEDWINEIRYGWADDGSMDYLFGSDYPYEVKIGEDLPRLWYTDGQGYEECFLISMDMLTPNIKPEPTYKPKGRIERTLESFNINDNDRYPYNEIVIKVNSNDDVKRVEELCSKSFKIDRTLVDSIKKFPNYFFIDHINDIRINGSTSICYLSDNPSLSMFRKLTSPGLPIFEINEWNKVLSIIKYNKIISPTYKPKEKIDRTIESNRWYPYRFKTKKEFEEEYGEDWRNIVRMTWASPEMDIFFGQPWPYDVPNRILLGGIEPFGGFGITSDMLTPNIKTEPTYKPKGKIERTLESQNSKNKYKYDKICIYLDDRDEITKMQLKLFDLGIRWSSQMGTNNPYVMYSGRDQIVLYIKLSNGEMTKNEGLSDYFEYKGSYNYNLYNYDPKLYNYEDINIIESIIKYGSNMIKPNYKPKGKIEREL